MTAEIITLSNDHLRVAISPYGATIRSLCVYHRQQWQEVVLGYGKNDDYLNDSIFLNCTPGRYANRIAGARFSVGGHTYQLAANEGCNMLHGGSGGFHRKTWQLVEQGEQFVTLQCSSADGEQGFPGNLSVQQTFRLLDSELRLEYSANTDQATAVNLTNHCYFNLSAEQDIKSHQLQINASQFVEVDNNGIPSGKLIDVTGTPFDFRQMASVGERLAQPHPQTQQFAGFDHNYAVDIESATAKAPKPVALAYAPDTDLSLTVLSSQPGLQFYSGQYLSSPFIPHQGLCLEAQQFPDAPNQASFPSAITTPEQPYHHSIGYRFSAGKASI